jgi:hypothetical protein
MQIILSDTFVKKANERMRVDKLEWHGTSSEWLGYIERLVMEDLGNL